MYNIDDVNYVQSDPSDHVVVVKEYRMDVANKVYFLVVVVVVVVVVVLLVKVVVVVVVVVVVAVDVPVADDVPVVDDYIVNENSRVVPSIRFVHMEVELLKYRWYLYWQTIVASLSLCVGVYCSFSIIIFYISSLSA
jgi:hypothetical protein